MLKALSFTLLTLLSYEANADVFANLLGVIKGQLAALQQQVSLQGSMDSHLKDQIQELTLQRKLLEESMQGHYGYGDLYQNSSITDWQHSGAKVSDALNALKGNDALANQAKQIADKTPFHNADNVFPHTSNQEKLEIYNSLGKTALAARASQQLSYNKVEEELKMLEALQAQIDKSPNIKSSLDLIARLQVETAKLLAYRMKNDALQGELSALETQKELSDDEWLSQFFNSKQ